MLKFVWQNFARMKSRSTIVSDNTTSYRRFLMDAYSASQLLEQLSATVVSAGHLTNKQKCAISEKLAGAAHRLLDGGAELMQLTDLGCTIIMANNNP